MMKNIDIDNIDIATPSVVKQAARDFCAAIVESQQFKAYEQAAYAFRRDKAAQEAMQAYQYKQQSMRPLLMLNAAIAEEKAELERLKKIVDNQPVIDQYFTAQAELAKLCQDLGDMISDAIGLNYAAACGVSCCG
jgi:cell fate (sporulation/competence/biofilm development) regulator YlbF (YheA/YmcA/DUF963 family)